MSNVQCHIHLDRDAPYVPRDTDNAPAARWRVTRRSRIPQAQVNVSRSHTGHTYMSRVVDGAGDPVVHNDWRYQLRVTQAELDYLVGLLGRELIFVDHRHPDDGTDATAYVKSVGLRVTSDIANLEPMLGKYDVSIELVDLEQPI